MKLNLEDIEKSFPVKVFSVGLLLGVTVAVVTTVTYMFQGESRTVTTTVEGLNFTWRDRRIAQFKIATEDGILTVDRDRVVAITLSLRPKE